MKKNVTAAKITEEYIKSTAADVIEASEKVKTAANLYLEDVVSREKALDEQAKEYSNQIEIKTKERKKLAEQVTDLASRGKIEEAADGDVQLETLDNELARLKRKLKLLQSTTLKGDADLYKEMKNALDKVAELQQEHKLYIRALVPVVEEEMKRLERIKKELWWEAERNYIGGNFDKVERHYHDLDRKEREAKEKEAELRKEEAKKKGGTYYVFA